MTDEQISERIRALIDENQTLKADLMHLRKRNGELLRESESFLGVAKAKWRRLREWVDVRS